MINKILVAVDGLSHAMKAVDFAADIAAGCGASLMVLTVIKFSQPPKISEELRAYAKLEQIGEADVAAMRSLSQGLLSHAEEKARAAGVKDVEAKIETGPAARTIVKFGEKNAVDLIVIGSRGMGNVEATLRGGVSHRVELLAKCSVLTVK